MSFYGSTTSENNEIVSVLSIRNLVNLSGSDFAKLVSQVLPATYLLKMQGSFDIRAGGYYKFCVVSSEPASVSLTMLDNCSMLEYICVHIICIIYVYVYLAATCKIVGLNTCIYTHTYACRTVINLAFKYTHIYTHIYLWI
jgi:hypothetical protein